jgi:hypothetical protein
MPSLGIHSKELRIRAVERGSRGRTSSRPSPSPSPPYNDGLGKGGTERTPLRQPPRGASGASSPLRRRVGRCGSSSKRTTTPPSQSIARCGKSVGGEGFSLRDEPGHAQQARMDLQKKTLDATERDERKRSAFERRLRGWPQSASSSWTSPRPTSPWCLATPGHPEERGLSGRRPGTGTGTTGIRPLELT